MTAAAAALVLAACGGASGGDATAGGGEEGGSVTLWMYPVIADPTASTEYWDGVVDRFTEAHSDIDFTVELQPWDGRLERVTTALASGSGPDIVLLTPEQVNQFAEAGSVQPVNDLLEDGVEPFNENATGSVTVDGETFAVPIYQTVLAPAYNTALLDELGLEIPTTWDDVREIAPEVVDAGYSVFDFGASPDAALNVTFFPFLWQAGGNVFTRDGSDIAIDSPEAIEALEFLVDLHEMGALAPDTPTVGHELEGRPFWLGDAIMHYGLDLSQVRQSAEILGEDNVVAGMPLTGEEQATYGVPGLLAVSHAAEDTEAVGTVLSFLSSPEEQVQLSDASGFFPARADAEVEHADEYAEVLFEASKVAVPGEIHPESPQVQSLLGPKIQAAFLGQLTPEEAFTQAAEEARAQIGK
ncbi:ABC transporter substrate-binding protein [Georgenia subflava]|uniref:ABC transporter substrate-binding protein n=1 Tax=Georgenia subflava TaxID=1622177 RepID=UPI00186B5137|nr:sugar ABC transporter substrate-binding protein [Georgenia subflava]